MFDFNILYSRLRVFDWRFGEGIVDDSGNVGADVGVARVLARRGATSRAGVGPLIGVVGIAVVTGASVALLHSDTPRQYGRHIV